MSPPRLEESVTIAAAPERVFAWADDPANTGWHMRRRSALMLDAALKLEQVSVAARGMGATYRWSGSVLGLTVDFTGTVAWCVANREKVWRTVGHELPRQGLPRLLGRALAPYGLWCLRRVCRDAKAALEDSGQGLGLARMTRYGGLLAIALLAGACARPAVVVTAPGPGVPAISGLVVAPAHIESGCPLRFRIQFEDAGRDVVRAVARWRAKTGYQRFHEGTDVLPFASEQLHGKSVGRVEVVVIPAHAGSYVYRIQLEDARGQISNVAEARVHVEIRPFWRRAACETPGEGTERVRRPNVQPPDVAGRS